MTPAALAVLLSDFYREQLELMTVRQANARLVAGYDANNGYQQVLGRQEIHLQWVAGAISDLGGSIGETASEPVRPVTGTGEHAQLAIEADVRAQTAFLERWAGLVDTVTNARNRKMLRLILGEMKEHLRVLQQAAEGRADLLGRHADGKVLRGRVLPARPRN